MKTALLSDIHANLRALDACMDHAAARGAQRFAVLGDLVGYGAQPAQVVRRMRELAQEGAIVLQGNHDAMAATPLAQAGKMDPSGAAWTRSQLQPADLDFLAGLPLTATDGAAFFVHASADAPQRWLYVDSGHRAEASLDAACADTRVRYVFGGHVHHQTLYFRGASQRLLRFEPTAGVTIPLPPHRRWIATVGSVGQPRDGNTDAMYAMFDPARAELTFHRVAYDHLAAAADVRAAGLPEDFAKRLERGL
ncbi:metallophosphoesterase family protein [Polaromonas sp.]|uniref:metallophosphoesterase family protein n=1 Tax=Polaromonas sp. TaxID=1869339 RepID=UPI002487699B|nr:metallophosphoesterase family protein [Polaromonas sp.]MDI1274587.1 metallophosphoesterase family protein [Polaromonas sp.]